MMSTITSFKNSFEPKPVEEKPKAPTSDTPKEAPKVIKKPIKSIMRPQAGSRPKSPLRVGIKERKPQTTTSERARIVLERSSRSGTTSVVSGRSGRSGLSNFSNHS